MGFCRPFNICNKVKLITKATIQCIIYISYFISSDAKDIPRQKGKRMSFFIVLLRSRKCAYPTDIESAPIGNSNFLRFSISKFPYGD